MLEMRTVGFPSKGPWPFLDTPDHRFCVLLPCLKFEIQDFASEDKRTKILLSKGKGRLPKLAQEDAILTFQFCTFEYNTVEQKTCSGSCVHPNNFRKEKFRFSSLFLSTYSELPDNRNISKVSARTSGKTTAKPDGP